MCQLRARPRMCLELGRLIRAHSSHSSTTTPTSEFLKERAALERGRLERQKRALALSMDSPMEYQTPGAGSSSMPDSLNQRPTKRARIASPPASNTPAPSGISGKPPQRNGYRIFWNGELRHTPSRFSLGSPTFDLKTIIGDTSDLAWCILSAMEVDFDWVANHIPSRIPTIIACSPPRKTEFVEAAVNELKKNFIRCTPRMAPGPGVMHTKVFLLFYKSGRLRVAVNTANLLDFDWWDIENMSWVQDFPLLSTTPVSSESAADSKPTTTSASLGAKFTETLATMLTRMNVGAAIQSLIDSKSLSLPANYTGVEGMLAEYDFSAVKVGLVPSIPGTYHAQSEMQSVGHTGLMRVLRSVGARCPPDKKLSLEYQGSSIGKYTADWVRGFQISAEGAMNGYEDWFEMPSKKRAALPFPKKEHLKIMFPTLQTVNRVGRQCGGSLFFSPSFWDAPKYPKDLFHDARSKTGPILMHTKMMLATFVTEQRAGSSSSNPAGKGKKAISGIDPDVGGWCYVGSHNFTPSAWGILVRGEKNAAAKAAKMPRRTSAERKAAEKKALDTEPHISIKNFELGVVFTLPSDDISRAAGGAACWGRPAAPYGLGDSGVPWMQSVHGLEV
ncbi:hypothetical protein BS47DRAFT_1337912 [Hydnum rufescens UP504]|uniref:Phospholipase D/nuclease n=1 Tax=Hydnum rufescens UP504 TaxID=1448309 RepID=A0A9P6B6R7_9AGAM|nr:hypothetical protein BS47DRAFT_1337912 [Hydnum rufescens UP504]